MHSQFKFFSLVLIALCTVNGVLSLPLDLVPLTPATTPAEQANEQSLNKAKDLANKNIVKMEHVLNNPTAPGHQEMIDAAFGTDPSLDMNHVKTTVQSLKTGIIPVKLATAPGAKTIAYTEYDDSTNPMSPTHVEFGKKYHAKETSDDARAATLIHEATHHISDTGDYIKNKQILNGADPETTRNTGYATGMEPKKTAADLNKDANWKKMRDGRGSVPGTKDLHKNAESYGQFSAMCGEAVSDETVCPKTAAQGEAKEKGKGKGKVENEAKGVDEGKSKGKGKGKGKGDGKGEKASEKEGKKEGKTEGKKEGEKTGEKGGEKEAEAMGKSKRTRERTDKAPADQGSASSSSKKSKLNKRRLTRY